jgi:hypothetical protein
MVGGSRNIRTDSVNVARSSRSRVRELRDFFVGGCPGMPTEPSVLFARRRVWGGSGW